jgi:G3E family GTPase
MNASCLPQLLSDSCSRPEAEDSGVRSFIYRARRPFHPSRLFAFLSGRLNREGETDKAFDIAYPEVLRSKGFFWLASRPTEMLIWSQAGGLFQLSPGGIWLADSSDEIKEAALAEAEMDWTSEEGDRRQELVFIGADMDEADLSAALDACLLTSAEVQLSADSWEDPFPPSEYADSLEHDHDHDHEHDHDHGHMFV